MLSLTIKNTCNHKVLLRSPIGPIPVGKEYTFQIDTDELGNLTADLALT